MPLGATGLGPASGKGQRAGQQHPQRRQPPGPARPPQLLHQHPPAAPTPPSPAPSAAAGESSAGQCSRHMDIEGPACTPLPLGAAPDGSEPEIPWEDKCHAYLQDEDPSSALSGGQHRIVVRHVYDQLGQQEWAAMPWPELKAALQGAALHLFPAIDPDPTPWLVVPPRRRQPRRGRRPMAHAATRSASPPSRTVSATRTPRSRSRSPPAARRSSGRVRRPASDWWEVRPESSARPAVSGREGDPP